MKRLTDQAIAPNSTKPDTLMIVTYKSVSRKLDVRNDLGGARRRYPLRRTVSIRSGRALLILLRSLADVAFHKIGVRIKMEAPNALQQHGAGHHLVGVLYEKFQQLVFPRL